MYDNTITVILLILIAVIYMLPTLIAYARDHPHRQRIAVIDLLFGWTLIVWVVVFVWALAGETEADELS